MTLWIWIGSIVLILGFLALDLGVFNRRPHAPTSREALAWSLVWVAVSLFFNVLVYFMYDNHWLSIGLEVGHTVAGREAAVNFFTAYLVEKSLSLDNIFVIAMIFSYFRVPLELQHRVLFWGVLGALVMRGIMIGVGVAVLQRYHWVTVLLGVFLIVTAVRMLIIRHDNLEPERNPIVRLVRRWYPVTDRYHGQRFFVSVDGRRAATPLFLALAMIESSDLMFAVDSIPAVFAVTLDPFIVFTSNVFAILGLRALYFVLAALMDRFRYLKMSLVFVLAYVGTKMILSGIYPIPAVVSLLFIVVILAVGVMASAVGAGRDTARLAPPPLRTSGKPPAEPDDLGSH